MKSIEDSLRPLQEAGLLVERYEPDNAHMILGDPQEGEIVCYHWICWLRSEKEEWVVSPHGFVGGPPHEFRLLSLNEAVGLILLFFQNRLVGIYDGHELVKNDQRVFEQWHQNYLNLR